MTRKVTRNDEPNSSKSKPYIDTEQMFYHSFTNEGFRRLRTYLGNIEKGNSKVYTAPFAKGDSMSKIIKDWRSILESLSDKWPTLLEFEDDLAKKVGPMSIQKPLSERMDDIKSYYEDILLPQAPISYEAINMTKSEFSGLCGLRLRSQKNTLDLMKKSTSAGAPWMGKKRNVGLDVIPCRVETAEYYGSRSQNLYGTEVFSIFPELRQDYATPAVLGWRGQEGGPSEEDVKQRVIWMFPYAVNLCELQVYQPLIEGAQKRQLVPAWVSNELVDARITALFDSKGKDDPIVCTDFSKFDQHFNPVMQNAAKSILRFILTDDKPSYDWLDKVFRAKYTIPLVYGYDHERLLEFAGLHGMASGSGGTNVDETLAHRCLQYEAAIKHDSVLNPNSQCLGDDGILSYPGITVEDVVRTYESHGQECNIDKQYVSTQDCVYLRRWHHTEYRVDGVCVGVYSTCRALGRLRYLERFMDPEYWSPELVALRQLSIIENCKWHPLFHEFIEFCMKRDKYRLGLDIPGFMDNITQLAIEATDHINDFLGYTKTLQGDGPKGISEWEVVKYLKSKR